MGKKFTKLGIRAFVNEHIENAGDDKEAGVLNAGNQLISMTEDEDCAVTLEDASLRTLFDGLCDPDGTVDRSSAQDVQEAMMSANFPAVTGSMIYPVIMREYDPYVKPVLSLVTETDSANKEETHVGFGALDGFELVREGMPYDEAQPAQRKCTIKNNKFGRKISVTMEMVLFDKTGDVLKVAKGIGKKGGQHLHKLIIQTATGLARSALGESSSTALVVDGTARAAYADTHAAWDGVANDNSAGTTTLTIDDITSALKLFNAITDDKGDLIMCHPKTIVCNSNIAIALRSLLGSPNVAWVGAGSTTDADASHAPMNPHFNAYTVIDSPFVTANKWYIGEFDVQTLLQWVYRLKTETLRGQTQQSFDNDIVAQYKAGYYVGCGLVDYRYVVDAGTVA